MIKVKKTPNWRRLKKRIDDTEDHVKLLGSDVIVTIKNRTLAGRDADNKSFKPYTATYKKRKSETHGSTKPNLFADGNMFKAMQSKVISGGVRLFFNISKEKEKAYANHNTNGRKFWALSTKQQKDLVSKLKRFYRTT